MHSWLPFAFTEGIARTGSLATIKAIGFTIAALGDAVAATLIIGAVQACASILLARSIRILWLGLPFFLGCLVFGTLAAAQTVLPFIVFSQGGELAIYTFLVVGLSIVPATLIDVACFRTQLPLRGWVGVVLAAFAGYIMLNMPTLEGIVRFPIWILLSFLAMLAFACNQVIVRALSRVNSPVSSVMRGLAQNAQVGVVTLVSCALTLPFLGADTLARAFSSTTLLLGSIFAGLWVVGIIVSGLMAYARGADVAVMRTVATGTFLTGSALAGWLLFGEALGLHHIAGLILFIIASWLVRQSTSVARPLGG
jgi:drug/metabolite transporter (DMT)-like permease